MLETDDYSPLKPLTDWLAYNGYTLVTKPAKEFTDAMGRRRVKGNMDIEIAVDMLELAPRLDHAVLFSGDSDFRRLVEAMQRKGVRVSVVSSIRTSPPMVADELRRQADQFLELADIAPEFTRRQTEPRPGPPGARNAGRAVPRALARRRVTADPAAPEADCALCPRLAGFRAANRAAHPEWCNAPVPSFGTLDAPCWWSGWRRGCAARTAPGGRSPAILPGCCCMRPCCGSASPHGVYAARADDGMALAGCRVTNAVRCVPPGNRRLPAEARTCRPFLAAEMEAMPGLRAVLALGVLAHKAVLRAWGVPLARAAFRHGALHVLPGRPLLADSYHVSRYNTNTGRLTEAMFAEVVAALRARLGVG